MLRVTLLCGAVSLLSACGSLERYYADSIESYNLPTKPLEEVAEADSGGSSVSLTTRNTLDQLAGAIGNAEEVHFNALLNDLENETNLLQAKLVQVDMLCDQFFTRLDRIYRAEQLLRKELNLAGNVAAGVLGFAGGTPEALASLALGDAFIQGSFENIENIFFLAPDPTVTYQMVLQAQDVYITDLKDEIAGDLTFMQVQNIARGYASLCTPKEIQRLVNQSVGNTDGTLKSSKDAAVNGGVLAAPANGAAMSGEVKATAEATPGQKVIILPHIRVK